jgi:hypothetical protein
MASLKELGHHIAAASPGVSEALNNLTAVAEAAVTCGTPYEQDPNNAALKVVNSLQ